jgi:hypothetical protein
MADGGLAKIGAARSWTAHLPAVMPALGAGIHVLFYSKKDVDGRDKPGHDGALNTLCAGIEFMARPYAGHDA